MEIIIDLSDLSQVLVLHLSPGDTLFAGFCGVGEQNLIDHDVVNVDLLLSQLDCQSFSLVHRQELGDANSHERCLGRVLELHRNLLDSCFHLLHAFEQSLLHVSW
jgi:hypothetical protein